MWEMYGITCTNTLVNFDFTDWLFVPIVSLLYHKKKKLKIIESWNLKVKESAISNDPSVASN